MAVLLKYNIQDVDQEKAAARLSEMHITGMGRDKCLILMEEEFGYKFTRSQLKNLEKREIYGKVKEEYTNSILKQARASLKEGVTKMVPILIQSLEEQVKNGSVPAMVLTAKILGVETAEPENKQAQQLTVVLPGAIKKEPKDVN